MAPHRNLPLFRKVLVPVVDGVDPSATINAGRLIGTKDELLLFGLVPVAESVSLSTGAKRNQELRKLLRGISGVTLSRTAVTHTPWAAVLEMIRELGPDLLILEWPHGIQAMGISLEDLLSHPPCDLALVRKPIYSDPKRILIPIRGGPYSELALRMGLATSMARDVELTSLHIRSPQLALTASQRRNAKKQEAAFQGIAAVLANLPQIKQHHLVTDDPAGTIIRYSKDADLVIMGASAIHGKTQPMFGETADKVLQHGRGGLIIVKSSRSLPPDLQQEAVGERAISVLVDKWFAENTYHASEFQKFRTLRELKEQQGLKISVALPALNEERTIGKVIRCLNRDLMQKGIVDEVVLMDSGSTDNTRRIASDLGIPVYIHQEVLPVYGGRTGKGEALWKSLFVTSGDIVLWLDTDISNFNPRFVTGLIGPLLADPQMKFVKGFYRRPLRVGARMHTGGGGRVTELTARPLLNLFFPELSGVVQPLSGEYGGKRSVLERLSFSSGYGVETGLLIDVFEKYGLNAIGQVDLEERIHHNQNLQALSLMSFAIIQVVVQRLEKRYGQEILEGVNKTMKLIRYEKDRFFLDVEGVNEQERPPMASLPEYQELQASHMKAKLI